MRALAEFVTRSRLHAIGTSMVTALLPLLGWLSTVIVAFVVLRQGIPAGSLVLLWTLLPVGVIFHLFGDPLPMMVLVGTFLTAAMLRRTGSWQVALITSVIYAAVSLLAVKGYLVDFLIEFLASMELELSHEEILQLTPLFAFGQAITLLILLILARWAQSALYNPGGFRKEFHQLRLSPVVSTAFGVAILACLVFFEQPSWWLLVLVLPLVVAAAGLVHWYFAFKNLSNGWVAVFYVSLVILFEFSAPLLASLALVDSWLNIRVKIQNI